MYLNITVQDDSENQSLPMISVDSVKPEIADYFGQIYAPLMSFDTDVKCMECPSNWGMISVSIALMYPGHVIHIAAYICNLCPVKYISFSSIKILLLL